MLAEVFIHWRDRLAGPTPLSREINHHKFFWEHNKKVASATHGPIGKLDSMHTITFPKLCDGLKLFIVLDVHHG